MQELLIISVIVPELLKNIIYKIIMKVIAQEVLINSGKSIIAQEEYLSLLFKG